jgi:hypothetical protein
VDNIAQAERKVGEEMGGGQDLEYGKPRIVAERMVDELECGRAGLAPFIANSSQW